MVIPLVVTNVTGFVVRVHLRGESIERLKNTWYKILERHYYVLTLDRIFRKPYMKNPKNKTKPLKGKPKSLAPSKVDALMGHTSRPEQEDENYKDIDLSKEISPCKGCGCKDSVYRDNEYHLIEMGPDIDLVVQAYVCRECGQLAHHNEAYREILEARESAEGRPYVKVVISGSNIEYHSLH